MLMHPTNKHGFNLETAIVKASLSPVRLRVPRIAGSRDAHEAASGQLVVARVADAPLRV